jgi:hypothetical protein
VWGAGGSGKGAVSTNGTGSLDETLNKLARAHKTGEEAGGQARKVNSVVVEGQRTSPLWANMCISAAVGERHSLDSFASSSACVSSMSSFDMDCQTSEHGEKMRQSH